MSGTSYSSLQKLLPSPYMQIISRIFGVTYNNDILTQCKANGKSTFLPPSANPLENGAHQHSSWLTLHDDTPFNSSSFLGISLFDTQPEETSDIPDSSRKDGFHRPSANTQFCGNPKNRHTPITSDTGIFRQL